jgi:predicted RND superfamily exporter protein
MRFSSVFPAIVNGFVKFTTKSPIVTVGTITLLTFFLATHAARLNDNISSDLDIYLPKGAEESRILKKIAREWATNIEIIYIETNNAYYPDRNQDNVTDKLILDEISFIEGDEWLPGLNWDREDRGKHDDIAYSLSISILIKEINSSGPRMANVLEDEMAYEIGELLGGENVNITGGDDEALKEGGHYAIPETQQQIDQIVSQIPENVLNSLVADTNGDGIWDTCYIMFGVVDDVKDEELRDRVDDVIDSRPSSLRNTKMSQTGIIPIMLDVTEEAMEQIMETMPYALLFTIGVILFLHRSPKILLIAGLPLLYTLIWTFGIIVMMDVMVSPIIVAAVPMLIGLSVDYGLHLANRIAEFQREEHEEVHMAISDSIQTTGKAILLSAMTTVIGFAALFTSDLQPIAMMGVTLVVGISSAFLLTMILIPNLVILTKYRKKPLAGWKTFSTYPVKYRWPIVAVVLIITLASLAQMEMMTETSEERPKERDTGIESITTIRKFSALWASGQSALLLIEGDGPGKLNDTPLLDSIDRLENGDPDAPSGDPTHDGINDIRYVNATSIVDVFKAVALNISWTTTESIINDSAIPEPLREYWHLIEGYIDNNTQNYYWKITYWEFIHWLPRERPPGQLSPRERAIKIFYKSLTSEMRAMLMSEDYDMTLMIINFPYMGAHMSRKIINNINDAVSDHRDSMVDGKSSKATGITALVIIADRAIVESQQETIRLSLIFVFIALTIIFFSPRIAALTMIPILLVVAWQPITMASVSQFTGGASLNMMTAMIGSIIIGTGIDYAVHISARIKEEGETIQGVMRATEHTGQTIAEATFTTVAGMSGGLAVTWFRGFFFIVIALLLYAMFAGLVLLPAVYAIYIKAQEKKYRRYMENAPQDPYSGTEVVEAEIIEAEVIDAEILS